MNSERESREKRAVRESPTALDRLMYDREWLDPEHWSFEPDRSDPARSGRTFSARACEVACSRNSGHRDSDCASPRQLAPSRSDLRLCAAVFIAVLRGGAGWKKQLERSWSAGSCSTADGSCAAVGSCVFESDRVCVLDVAHLPEVPGGPSSVPEEVLGLHVVHEVCVCLW
ncbi:hypothetical protein CpipJ_CPIJ013370 [Culex quinquefasciatus]|uniref:Uncharacterized protein n=1 Tax=Culex quinquefasciatus TaxID=7176 RepID=B0X2H3_CULQU|nr:hypothetical protein CpipJ_CPIJ013370 [Culex quinquefasciatus]|eukprot:XP_001863845.1 hypothetical protein CpipJ_CPIJ013370 [Culex quinquefasciatus]